MRTTLVQRGLEFGKLAKIRGIVYFRLSPHEQKPFGGVITHGVPNIIRRMRDQVLRVVPPFIGAYLVYSWANQEHERLVRKKPDDFKDDKVCVEAAVRRPQVVAQVFPVEDERDIGLLKNTSCVLRIKRALASCKYNIVN
ncbi:hypothetical protein PV327_008384 [Microctonus hyperodae]|uniref:Cytochrome b-c1 complex subunit 8 n=1 Tax=Microctonus hyperodae TaxID=165561 RepID=A0AA39F2Z9_MICHY|nr:hypothetical protein PV327_008384 [Microctonus hyperodae]